VIAYFFKITDIAREHQEVVVGQSTVDSRIQKNFCVQTISFLVFVTKYIESLCVVQDLLFGHELRAASSGIAIGESHGWRLPQIS